MARFIYRAMDEKGFYTNGEHECTSKKELEQFLNAKGLFLVSCSQPTKFKLHTEKIKLRDIIIFSRQFSVLSNAGISQDECIRTIAAHSEKDSMRNILNEIAEEMQHGKPLSECMEKHEKVFGIELPGSGVEVGAQGVDFLGELIIVAGRVREVLYVHEGHRGGHDLFGVDQLGQYRQALVRQRYDASVRFDGGERVVFSQHVVAGQCVEHGGLADVGQSDDSDSKRHDSKSREKLDTLNLHVVNRPYAKASEHTVRRL